MNWKKRAKNVVASVEIMQFYGDTLQVGNLRILKNNDILAFMIPAVCGGIVFASPYILHEILKVDERMNQTAEVDVEP